jgi:GNAT superfamily N-acetyltransferase
MRSDPPPKTPAPEGPGGTAGGADLLLRPIRAGDVGLLRNFLPELSYGSRYFRFGNPEVQFTDEELRSICTPDPQECIHLLILRTSPVPEALIGSARIVFDPDGHSAELAIAVKDDWHRHGIGSRLLAALKGEARQRGQRVIYARTLATNTPMQAFLRHEGFVIADSPEGAWLKRATLSL